LDNPDGQLTDMVVPRSTEVAIGAARDGSVRVWNVATGERTLELAIGAPVTALAASDGYPLRFCAATHRELSWWTIRQNAAAQDAAAPLDETVNGMVALDANTVVAASEEGSLTVWHTQAPGSPVVAFRDEFPIDAVARSDDDRTIFSLDRGGAIAAHDLQ